MTQKLFTLLAVSALTAGSALAAPAERFIQSRPAGSPFATGLLVNAPQGENLFTAPVQAPAFSPARAEADVPEAVATMTCVPGADYGELVMTWSPVTKMVSGAPVPETMTYTICQLKDKYFEPVVEGITTTNYTIRAVPASAEQQLVMYAIYAVVPGEDGAEDLISNGGAYTGYVAVGRPDTMPYAEGFTFDHMIGTEIISGGGSWEILPGYFFSSQDGDDACAAFTATDVHDTTRIFTGRIHIDENAQAPTFSYYFFNQFLQQNGEQAIDLNELQVQVNDGSGYKDVGSITVVGTGNVSEWNRVAVSLADYKGKDVQLAVKINVINGGITILDNFRVLDVAPNDLAISVAAPLRVTIGEELPIVATLYNYGSAAAKDYTVNFIINGTTVGVVSGPEIPVNGRDEVMFNYPVPANAEESLLVTAVAEIADDGDLTNNEAVPCEVAVKLPTYPAVDNLTFRTEGDGSVTLSWSEPNYKGIVPSYLEDFESFTSFATKDTGDLCGWKFVDRDGGTIGGFTGYDLPNASKETEQSFIVLDNTYPNCANNDGLVPHSGNKALMALYNVQRNIANNDWAISPELSGNRQTITFYARAYDDEYCPEILDVMASSTDTEISSFTLVKSFNLDVDYRYLWTDCSVTLPKGTKYFAFRYNSTFKWLVLIDDVTYEPAGMTELNLEGYNIYCNDTKLNDAPVADRSFVVKNPVEGAAYSVTVHYTQGESGASNRVVPVTGGVEIVGGSITGVRGAAGSILVAGTDETVEVFDLQGRCIYNGAAGVIPASAGAYIVRIGENTWKVLVK